MPAADLCFTPARHLTRLIRRKLVSPVEVMRAVLARIETLNPTLNAYCTVVPETALKAAETAERAVTRGRPLGPLEHRVRSQAHPGGDRAG